MIHCNTNVNKRCFVVRVANVFVARGTEEDLLSEILAHELLEGATPGIILDDLVLEAPHEGSSIQGTSKKCQGVVTSYL